ncbi:MAG TPA: class I SAM-dependent methyltransferase [Polyangiaceae bacterium]
MQIFYEFLAPWWPLISPVEDYEAEARHYRELIEARAPAARTLLELGSGGGHNAFYLKQRFAMTLSDLSDGMLAVSAKLNPDCEHVRGDMRSLELNRRFDVVFVHDAIDYMTTEADLEAALGTAYRHLVPGGLALFVPDHVRERFEPGSECGGSDAADGRAVRFLEWTPGLAPDAATGTTHYNFLVRSSDGAVQAHHERHEFGLFSEATWVRLLERRGFEVEITDDDVEGEHTPRLCFFARRRGGA